MRDLKGASARQGRMDRAWAEISLDNLRHNASVLQRFLPEACGIMAVVKANAYGHGDIEISEELNCAGIRAFAVATADEGIRLRQNGIQGEILILGYTDPRRAAELSAYQLSQTLVDTSYALELNRQGKAMPVHIKVDSGMHRLGESCDHSQEISQIFRCDHLKVKGIFTHLCVSDSREPDDIRFTGEQITAFYSLIEQLKEEQIPLPKIHIQSSYGVLNYSELQCDYARIGLALYGATSRKSKATVRLKPVLSLKARVVLVRAIAAGESVGYSRHFVSERNTYIAVISIGYADGMPRRNRRGCALLHGRRAPIIGTICMDQLMVDVTDIPGVTRGDIATLIGCDGGEEISAEEVATNADTITNDLLSGLSNRLERVFIPSRIQGHLRNIFTQVR